MTDIDTTKPNAGRIYDYLLGGSHNFDADRQTADRLVQMVPFAARAARANRWVLHTILDHMAGRDLDGYLDLATGLPTEGYIHELVPPTVPIVYNDYDSVTVAYGQTIVADRPNITYVHADIRTDVDRILDAATDRLRGARRVGVICVGVAYFLTDAEIQHLMTRLYDWCAPGSQMALSWLWFDATTPQNAAALQMYTQLGTPVYARTPDEITAVLHPWTLTAPGVAPFTTWLGDDGIEDWRGGDVSVQGYATVVEKQ